MARRLKIAVLWLSVVLVIWVTVGVAWYWRSYEPSNNDLLLGLVGVPALLIAGYALLKRVFGSMLRTPAAAEPAQTEGAVSVSSDSAAVSSGPQIRLLALGGSVKMSAGGAQELMQACAEGVRPELDEQLRDEQGFPVMVARVAELDDIDALEWWDGLDLDAALPQARVWVSQLPDARVREMRLLADVLVDSVAAAERDLLNVVEQQFPVDMQQTPQIQLPLVQVRLVLEPGWARDDLSQLQSWAMTWLRRAAPILRFDVQMYPEQAVGPRADFPWTAALLEAKDAAFLRPSNGSGAREEIWLLAAAHSDVSQPEIDSLAAEGRLYGPKRREGWIAGEGAAALVLLRYQPELGATPLAARLQAPVIASAKSIPAADVGNLMAQHLVAPMLEACAVPAANVGKVLSDADHRAASAMDTAMLLAQQFPDLSVEKDCAMVGVPSGHTAGVAALACLILAADFAAQGQCPALAVTQASESWRAAALLMPPGWNAAADAQAQNSLG